MQHRSNIRLSLWGCAMQSKIGLAIVATGVSALATVGLSSTVGASRRPERPKPSASLRAEVPHAIRSSGKIMFATAALGEPYSYVKAGTSSDIVGVEPALMRAVGQVLGLKVDISEVGFASLVPSVQSGRFDMGGNGLNDTATREQQVQMLDYGKNWSTIVVPSGNPQRIHKPMDLCGKSVVSLVGAAQYDWLQTLSTSCQSSGKPAVDLVTTSVAPQVALEVEEGKADATVTSHATSSQFVFNSHGKLSLAPKTKVLVGYVGLMVPKGSGLAKPVLGAMKELMHDGVYARIMRRYRPFGMVNAMIAKPKLDAAGS